MLKNGLLLIIASIISLLLAEVVLRLFMGDKIKTYADMVADHRYVINGTETAFPNRYTLDTILSFKLKPSYQEHHIDKSYDLDFNFTTNAEGFRQSSDLKNFKNPAHVPSIMVLGDSVTFGHGVDFSDSYPEVLHSYYQGKTQVLNFGVGGWSFAEYFLTYKLDAKRIKPDLVIVGVFLGNDFRELARTGWEGKPGALPEKINRRDYYIDTEGNFRNNTLTYKYPILRSSYLWILASDRFLDQRYSARIAVDPFDPAAIAASLLTEIGKQQQMLVVIFPAEINLKNDQPNANHELTSFLQKLSLSKNVKILDMTPTLLLQKEKQLKLYSDGSHFTKEGNLIVAKKIAEYIDNADLLPALPH
jgi:lysophospholipase L1-like esterase